MTALSASTAILLIAASAARADVAGLSPAPQDCDAARIERNKEIARSFYRDLWLTNNTAVYQKYVADTYVVHDVGERALREPAVHQKDIADFFWRNADLRGEIDFQIAGCDLVATRWRLSAEPRTFLGRFLGINDLPIINVFRIENSKIVEIWNHRHDIETGMTLPFVLKGLGIGLLISLIPTIYAFVLRRRLRRAHGTAPVRERFQGR